MVNLSSVKMSRELMQENPTFDTGMSLKQILTSYKLKLNVFLTFF